MCKKKQELREQIMKKGKNSNFDVNNIDIGPLKRLHNFNNFQRCIEDGCSFQIQKILHKYEFHDQTNRAYYLIKWKKFGYSLELNFFLERHPYYSLQVNLVNTNLNKKTNASQLPFDIGTEINEEVLNCVGSQYKYLLEYLNDNLFLVGEDRQINKVEDEIFIPFFTQLMTNSNNSRYYILICVENDEDIKKWKYSFKNSIRQNILYLNSKSTNEKIVFEMIKFNKRLNNIGPKKLSNGILLNNPEVYDLNEPVIVTTLKIFTTQPIFAKIRFNIQYFHISSKNYYNKYSDFIINNDNTKKYILTSYCPNFNDFLYKNYLEFFINISSITKYNPGYPPILVNNNHKFYSEKREEMREILRKQFGWTFDTLIEEEIQNWNELLLNTIEQRCEIIPLKSNISSKPKNLLINFLPINISQEEFQQYNIILADQMKVILEKKDSKVEIIKNLAMVTSFPNLVSKYFVSIFKNSWTNESFFSISKIAILTRLIDYLNEISTKKEDIFILYSLSRNSCNVNFGMFSKLFYDEVIKNTKTKNIKFFSIEEENVYKSVEKSNFSHIIIFNFYLFGKEFFNLYRKLFPFSHKVILYQLYTQNSVEENLIKLIYSRFDEFLLDEESTTKKYLHQEENNWIIKNNYRSLNPTNNTSQNFIFNSQILTTLKNISQSEGIIVTKNDNFLYVYKCNIFKGSNRNFWVSDFCELVEPKLADDEEEISIPIEKISVTSEGSYLRENDIEIQIEEEKKKPRKKQTDLRVLINNSKFNYYVLKQPSKIFSINYEILTVKDVIEHFYEDQNKVNCSQAKMIENYFLKKGFLINIRQIILDLLLTFGINTNNFLQFCKDFQQKLIDRKLIKYGEDVLRLYLEFFLIHLRDGKNSNFLFFEKDVKDVLIKLVLGNQN